VFAISAALAIRSACGCPDIVFLLYLCYLQVLNIGFANQYTKQIHVFCTVGLILGLDILFPWLSVPFARYFKHRHVTSSYALPCAT
ncbi:hypothetical protein, partial [Morganella morganii]|uniref:hypothetical protein n=1 Tax=Morganella morganii TaxID=582 RepID=UPI003BA067A2